MALGQTHVIIGIVTVFIAVFMIFFILDSLAKLSDQCKGGSGASYCQYFSSFTVSILVVLLLIGGFVIVITAVAYIMLTTPSSVGEI